MTCPFTLFSQNSLLPLFVICFLYCCCRWWWRSFLSGGMVGVFIYAYCFFYYFNHSGMSGFLQTSFYFGYMFHVAMAAFLMMGSVGFYSAWFFVRYIYSSIKTD